MEVHLRNYRRFTEKKPAKLDLSGQFTSIVGPNNAGKSSLLRVLIEFKDAWRRLVDPHHFHQVVKEGRLNFDLPDVYSADGLWSDVNERPVSIEVISRANLSRAEVSRLRLVCDRSPSPSWNVELYIDGRASPVPQDSSSVLVSGNQRIRLAQEGLGDIAFANIARETEALSKCYYIGSFRNVVNQGAANYYGVQIGNAFVTQWHAWKNGNVRHQNREVIRVQEDVARLLGLTGIDVSPSADGKSLQITINGNKTYNSAEVGAGMLHLILVLGNAAMLRPSWILVDEPEIGLHPRLQIDFLTTLGTYASRGIVFATHSIGLARAVSDRIYAVMPTSQSESVLYEYDTTARYAEFLGEMCISASVELGATGILCVEGVHDIKVFQQVLRKMKLDHRFVLLPLGGDRISATEQPRQFAEVQRITPHIGVIADSERPAEHANPISIRNNLLNACKELGIRAHLTERRSIENYFTDAAIKAVLGQGFGELGPYAALPENWPKGKNWRIAREMSESDWRHTDIWKFLESLQV